jgi:hypothetical protein
MGCRLSKHKVDPVREIDLHRIRAFHRCVTPQQASDALDMILRDPRGVRIV